MARMPPAAKAAILEPSTLDTADPTANPATAAMPQARTTQDQSPATRRQLQPVADRSADGATAWGMFETKTAPMKAALTGSPLAS